MPDGEFTPRCTLGLLFGVPSRDIEVGYFGRGLALAADELVPASRTLAVLALP